MPDLRQPKRATACYPLGSLALLPFPATGEGQDEGAPCACVRQGVTRKLIVMGSSPLRPPRASAARLQAQSGFGFVAVLLALLIAATLYFGYFKLQNATSEKATSIAAIDATRAVACRSNRQNIERAITMWSVSHPDEAPTLRALEADGVRIPSCPEGGRYSLTGREVHCSKHG